MYYSLLYIKGSVVLHLLGVAIKESTNCRESFESLVRYVYKKYMSKGKFYTVEDLLSATNGITRIDFKTFFDVYVYGNERLPILASGGGYVDILLAIWEKIYPARQTLKRPPLTRLDP